MDLNVGGVLYTTSVETLTKVCEKYLALQNKKKAAIKKARIELRLTLRNIKEIFENVKEIFEKNLTVQSIEK